VITRRAGRGSVEARRVRAEATERAMSCEKLRMPRRQTSIDTGSLRCAFSIVVSCREQYLDIRALKDGVTNGLRATAPMRCRRTPWPEKAEKEKQAAAPAQASCHLPRAKPRRMNATTHAPR